MRNFFIFLIVQMPIIDVYVSSDFFPGMGKYSSTNMVIPNMVLSFRQISLNLSFQFVVRFGLNNMF